MSSDLMSRAVLEHVSPYKICVMALIQEYCLIKTSVKNKGQAKRVLFGKSLKPDFKRDFCMLALQLTQSPDMVYSKFMEVLERGKYKLQQDLLSNFNKKISVVLEQHNVCSLFDIFASVDRLTDYALYDEPLIYKSSKIGIYVRRVRLYFEKLSFDETVKVFKDLQNYINNGRNRSESLRADTETESMQKLDSQPTMDLDFSSVQVELSAPPLLDHSLPNLKQDSGRWSKQQVDVFVTEQAKLLVNQPALAMSPQQLQQTIHQILNTSCQHVDAHYLSYLNCVRSKEVNGAVSSLYHFFDRKPYPAGEDDRRALRLASLNLAILHSVFNRKEQALSALNEAVTLAHEANDNVTLQYCQTWIHILNKDATEAMFERCLSKCEELNLGYLLSFTYQAFAQSSNSQPSTIFELLSKSESINGCDRELTMVQAAALWSLYGQSDLAVLSAQRLLCLASYSSPSIPIALAILIQQFALRGEYEEGVKVLEESRVLVGGNSNSEWLVLSEGLLLYSEALHRGHWQQAQQAIKLISLVDNNEANLRSCEVMLAKGDRRNVEKLALSVLEDKKVSAVSQVRALRLLSQCDRATAPIYLAKAYTIANFNYLRFYRHLIMFDILNKHVEWGRGSPDIEAWCVLSSCSYSHISDCLVIHAKARILSAANDPTALQEELATAVRLLDQAQLYARALQDYARLKNISYLQAVICDNIGLISDRNKYSFQFRTLDEQFPSFNASLCV